MMDDIKTQVSEHVQSKKPTKPKTSGRKWSNNIIKYEELWEMGHKELFESCIAFEALNISFCCKCSQQVFVAIRCNSCNGYFCAECDSKFHFNLPFHSRSLLQGLETLPLKPTEFIVDGEKLEKSHFFSNYSCKFTGNNIIFFKQVFQFLFLSLLSVHIANHSTNWKIELVLNQ